MSKEVIGPQNQSAQAQNAAHVINNINIHVLVQSFIGQIAPGIFATENAGYLQTPLGEDVPAPDTPCKHLCPHHAPHPISDVSYIAIANQITFSILGLASICSPESIPPSLESHDPLTRMLFYNCRFLLPSQYMPNATKSLREYYSNLGSH